MTALPGRHRPRWLLTAFVLCLTSAVTGCAASLPMDVDGTLGRVRSDRVLRVGASHHPPQVVQPAEPDGEPNGTEVDLVTGYADHPGARVEWTMGSEASLVEGLGEGDLDLAVAGFEATSPWAADVALTRPYTTDTGRGGRRIDRVLAAPAGENALLVNLERWLDTLPEEQLR